MTQVGDVFGCLTFRERLNRVWSMYTCSCGAIVKRRRGDVVSGRTRSCGHIRQETYRALAKSKAIHGMRYTPTYKTWSAMRERCLRTTHKAYNHYGGRGIDICERWSEFSNFLSDMGIRPEGKSLERKNNNLGYTPDNCVWATPLEQGRNKRNNKIISLGSVSMTLSMWAERLRVSRCTIQGALRRGETFESFAERKGYGIV